MADKKTIYKLSWSPSKETALAYLLAVPAIMYLPTFFQFPVHGNVWIVAVLELLAATAATLFFYEGLKRTEQFKVLLVVLSNVGIFGVLSNLFHRATFFMQPMLILTDLDVLGLVNGLAVVCTLLAYRLKKEEGGPAGRALVLPFYTKIPPIGISAIIFFATMLAMVYLPYMPPYNKTWSANLPFFICVLLFITVGSGFYFFKTSPRSEKMRMGLLILALSTLFGTIGNTTNHLTEFHVGYRILMNASGFIYMNAGAILCVTCFFIWKRFLAAVTAKASAAADDAAKKTAEAPKAPEPAAATTAAATTEASGSAGTAETASTATETKSSST